MLINTVTLSATTAARSEFEAQSFTVVESSFDSHHENLMRTAIRAPWWLLRRPTSGFHGFYKSGSGDVMSSEVPAV